MKCASILLVVLGTMLIVWGIVDICNFSATGKDLLQFYDQSDVIKNLVHYSLISGLVKIALGILATGIFLFIWKKHYF